MNIGLILGITLDETLPRDFSETVNQSTDVKAEMPQQASGDNSGSDEDIITADDDDNDNDVHKAQKRREVPQLIYDTAPTPSYDAAAQRLWFVSNFE